MKKIIYIPLALALSACAGPQVLPAKPETIIHGASMIKIRSTISQVCDESQLFLEQQTTNMVICSKDADQFSQAWYGSQYGTTVRTKYQFNMFGASDGGVKVNGTVYLEDQNAYGRTDRQFLPEGPAAKHLHSMIKEVQARLTGGKKK